MSGVVRLVDRAGGYSPDDLRDLAEWAAQWIDAIGAGKYGDVKSIAIVLEGANGATAVVSQSLHGLDMARLVGLLHITAHRRMDGGARIEEIAG